MSYPYDFTVFIGRFQPFHAGHLNVVKEGLQQANKLIVLIGSAWQPRNPRNPWTHEEREAMIRGCLSDAENTRLVCMPLMDVPYNDELWVRNVQTTVAGLVTAHHHIPHKLPKIALIGHEKDHTGFYLKLFPQWQSIGVKSFLNLSATPLRESFFAGNGSQYLQEAESSEVFPAFVLEYLRAFAAAEHYRGIQEEIAFVKKYKQAWEHAPYPPTFVTVDSIVVQSGHVLLIERRANPGKGLLALPGGFVDQNERLLQACIRELREETRLKVPEPVLKGCIKHQAVYDEPNRSARGRTITHAFYIELAPNAELPKVKGSDDARSARWIPLAELAPQTMFEDHYFIIQDMLGLA